MEAANPRTAVQQRRDLASRQKELARLYDQNIERVYRYVYRRCGDHEMAQDVAQDVFVSVARRPEEPTSITIGWLLTAARNRMIDLIRRRQTRLSKVAVLAAGLGDTDDIEQLADQARVNEAVDRLLPSHRLVLILHYVDGYRVAELAEMLDRSPKGAEALITRARAAFRSELEVVDE